MASRLVEKLYSRNGLPILQIGYENKLVPIHSKYDPIKEAERIIDSHRDEIEDYDHVLFYGVGIGYHVKLFLERYPNKLASAYEPIQEVYDEIINESKVVHFPIKRLKHFFVEKLPIDLDQNLSVFSQHLSHKVLLIILPVYEKVASEEIKKFSSRFKEVVQNKRINTFVELNFAKRWTLNALMNLETIFETENILCKKNMFVGKPVILAAAGPSLSEEIKNLKIIKEHGLAYIFAVGSANQALIENEIYPDAILTYDPQAHNHSVFKSLLEKNIDTIPMILGSTVGFETVQMYKGPKLHFLTSQDTITPYFYGESLSSIRDSSSIAIITLQLFNELRVGKVILVGQNFAFKNNLFYSKEIARFDSERNEISSANVQKKDLHNSYLIKDTLGGKVLTNRSFDNMRREMEMYIKRYSTSFKVINTTKGGAEIEGTTYTTLEEIVEGGELLESSVDSEWYMPKGEINKGLEKSKIIKFKRDIEVIIELTETITNLLLSLEQATERITKEKIQIQLEKFDNLFQKLLKNDFYTKVLNPITRIHFDKLRAETTILHQIELSDEKVNRIIKNYIPYIEICREVYKEITPIIQTVVLPSLDKNNEWKEYVSTSGIFYYSGSWKKKPLLSEESENSINSFYSIGVETNQTNDNIKFNFTGTKLRILGTNHSKGLLKLRIMIDGQESIVKIKKSIDEESYGSHQYKTLFEITSLSAKVHNATIEILTTNSKLVFQGIQIDKYSRAYHIDEVLNINDLEIGKRIRCNYKAKYNNIGEFSNLGNEKGKHLPVNGTPNPNGDFYFIMVDDINGEKILISDRNVQNWISWSKVLDSQIDKYEIMNDNQWDIYMVKEEDENDLIWNIKELYTMTGQTKIDKDHLLIQRGFMNNNYSIIKNNINSVHNGVGIRVIRRIKITEEGKCGRG